MTREFRSCVLFASLMLLPMFMSDTLAFAYQRSVYDREESIESVPYVDGREALSSALVDVCELCDAEDVIYMPLLLVSARVNNFVYQTKLAAADLVNGIAVLYPEVGEPFQSIFSQMIDGIENKVNGRVLSYPIKSTVDTQSLADELKTNNTRVVIALGQPSLKVAAGLDANFKVVVGGVMDYQEPLAANMQINSLAPDPALLFSRLKVFVPKVKKIYVIHSAKNNEMAQLAKVSAQEQGLILVSYEVSNLKEAVNRYQSIFEQIDKETDALWLLQDSVAVDEKVILPMVLQESWDRDFPVFSSNFSHVKRGVLFSMYPNNVELGRNLAGSAIKYLSNEKRGLAGLLPLREVLVAVNIRTARHLGVELMQKESFDIAFPER